MPLKSPTARPPGLTLTALFAVALADAAMYTANFLNVIRMNADVSRWNYSTFFAYAAGMGLGAALLPKALRRLRGETGRRSVWPLTAILAAALAVRLPGFDAWEYGFARDCAIVTGHGVIVAGVFILFFSAVPPGRRGFWYGCGLSAGFLWWRVMQSLTHGRLIGAEAPEWYAFFYTAQTVFALLMVALIFFGFAKLPPHVMNMPSAPETPAPETSATTAMRPERGQILWMAGTLLLFYIANGFVGARLSPAVSNAGNGGADAWTGHIPVILACPLFGMFLDRRKNGARTLMLAASVFLMLAPPVNVLSESPFLYSVIVSLGTLAQFAVLMTAILMFAGMGTTPGWFGAAVMFQFSLRLVSFLVSFLWRKIPDTGDGVAVFLATAAAVGFHLAARKMHAENDAASHDAVPAAAEPDSNPMSEPEPVSAASRKYGLTPRESEVLALFTDGKNTKDISQLLFISEYTVRKHFQGIMTKMEVSSRNALLLKVLQEK